MAENVPSDKEMFSIQPYEALSEEVRALVDADTARLHEMQDTEIMQYGWDLQSKKTEIINEVLEGFENLTTEEINGILDDIMQSQKSVIPRPRRLFIPEFRPTTEQKRQFVGKVGDLEELLSKRIDAILANNANYIRLIGECKNMVDQYAICMMAIDKYLSETNDPMLREALLQKKQSLAAMRASNMQSALMYMKLYQNNALLVNRLNEVIHLNLHQLQEQVLIQTETNEIKNALKECQSIKESIQELATNNIRELASTGKMLEQTMEEPSTADAEKKMQELVANLSKFSTGDCSSAISSAEKAEEEASNEITTSDHNMESLLDFAEKRPTFTVPEEYDSSSSEEKSDEAEEEFRLYATKKGCNYAIMSKATYIKMPNGSKSPLFSPFSKEGWLSKEWFKEGETFCEGFARVKRFHRKGAFYINREGHFLNKKGFISASKYFSEGYAVVETENGVRFLGRDGKFYGNWIFLSASPFCHELAVVRIKEHGKQKENYLTHGNFLLLDESVMRAEDFDGQNGLIQISESEFNYIKRDGSYLYKKGNFYLARPFVEDIACVEIKSDEWNFINRNGNLISDVNYYEVFDFKNDFGRVMQKQMNSIAKYTWLNYINRNGDLLLDEWMEEAHPFRDDGYAFVQRPSDHLVNYVKKDGSFLSDEWFYQMDEESNSESFIARVLLLVEKDGAKNKVWFLLGYDGKLYDFKTRLVVS